MYSLPSAEMRNKVWRFNLFMAKCMMLSSMRPRANMAPNPRPMRSANAAQDSLSISQPRIKSNLPFATPQSRRMPPGKKLEACQKPISLSPRKKTWKRTMMTGIMISNMATKMATMAQTDLSMTSFAKLFASKFYLSTDTLLYFTITVLRDLFPVKRQTNWIYWRNLRK